MNFSPKIILCAAGILGGLLCMAVIGELQPTRRLDSAFKGMLRQVEKRNWENVKERIAPDYHDRWGFTRDSLTTNMREGFRQFFTLGIKTKNGEVSVQGDRGRVKAGIALSGRGTGVAEYIGECVNSLQEPFTFVFRKQSWKPWDWKLESVEQPELPLDSSVY
ncbi:MAG: hypothetical protein ABI615_04720 [Chthoniobacterales bacterium]